MSELGPRRPPHPRPGQTLRRDRRTRVSRHAEFSQTPHPRDLLLRYTLAALQQRETKGMLREYFPKKTDLSF